MTSDNQQESSYDLGFDDVALSRPKHPYSRGISGLYDRRMFEISEKDKPVQGNYNINVFMSAFAIKH